MYYALNPKYSLRGWEKLPFALCKKGVAEPYFMYEDEFVIYTMLDGETDFDSANITEEQRKQAKELEKNKVVSSYNKPHPISKEQRHYVYPNRFFRGAHWSITGKCNFKCKHCSVSAPNAKMGELSHDIIMDIIDQLHECGVREVSLTGGEPLVRKDFWEIVDKLLEYEIIITQIYSNGKLITDDFLDKLIERGLNKVEISMSYDGKGYHDWLRGIDGAEQYVHDAFVRCKEKGIKTSAEMCVHKDNVHVLRESINYLASVGCKSVKVNNINDSELWVKGGYDLGFTIKGLYNHLLDYLPHFFEDGAPITLMLGSFFVGKKGNTKAYELISDAKPQNLQEVCMCRSARKTMCISPDGVVVPCFPFINSQVQDYFPSILDIGLKKCINDSTYINFVQQTVEEVIDKIEDCKNCKHKEICLGGCRAAGCEASGGNLFGKDVYTCEIFKGGWENKIRKVCDEAIKKYNK